LDTFIARVRKLRDAQFNVLVSQVMTPQWWTISLRLGSS